MGFDGEELAMLLVLSACDLVTDGFGRLRGRCASSEGVSGAVWLCKRRVAGGSVVHRSLSTECGLLDLSRGQLATCSSCCTFCWRFAIYLGV